MGHSFSSKEQGFLISWLQSASAVILDPLKIKSITMFPLFPHLFAMKWWDQMPWSLFFEFWILSQLFHSPLSLSSRGSLVPLHFLPFSSVQFSGLVVSDSLRPHESQHARPPCPSPTAGVHSDSRPSSPWCHLAISSSVIPFSSCPHSRPASKSFPMSQLFAWGSQSTGASALESFLPEKSQGWCPSEWTGWISLQSKGLSRVFSNTTVQNINSSALSLLHSPTLTSIHDHRKHHSLD